MFKNYVIFREESNTHEELYVHENTDEDGGRQGLVVAEDVEDALHFATAREAYDWAAARRLDWWRVGLR